MKKTILILAVLVCSYGYSQVGIGTSTPSDKSILDLTATDRGFLLPRVTTALRNAIAPNATTDKGMQVYDTDTASIWYWDGSSWQPLAVGNAPKFAQFSANAAQVFNTTGQKVDFPVTTVNVGFTISGNNKITLPQGRIYKVELNLPWAAMAGSFCRFAIYNSTTNAQISQVAHLESATTGGAISGSGFTSTFVNTSSASVVIDVRYLQPNGQNTTLNDLGNGQAFATITIQAVD